VPALSVHSGPDSHDRTQAIAQLTNGAARVNFTVDLFNEGVDIPCVDQVLFLRPTESMTVFVQQLGRGLRLHERKSFLTVVDFIGNYRRASFKLPFLTGIEGTDPDAQRQAFRKLSAHEGELMLDGVEIHLAPVALSLLKQSLDQGQRLKDALREDWAALAAALGRAPLMMEVELRSRFSVRQFRQSFGDWFGVLEQCGGMTEGDRTLESQCGAFLRELESTQMTKSYKMVTLQAMFHDGVFQRAVSASASEASVVRCDGDVVSVVVSVAVVLAVAASVAAAPGGTRCAWKTLSTTGRSVASSPIQVLPERPSPRRATR
jgi:hypothetical protein